MRYSVALQPTIVEAVPEWASPTFVTPFRSTRRSPGRMRGGRCSAIRGPVPNRARTSSHTLRAHTGAVMRYR